MIFRGGVQTKWMPMLLCLGYLTACGASPEEVTGDSATEADTAAADTSVGDSGPADIAPGEDTGVDTITSADTSVHSDTLGGDTATVEDTLSDQDTRDTDGGIDTRETGGGTDAGDASVACASDEKRCVGDVLQVCRSSGQFERLEDCEFGCANGACLPAPVCEAGELRCNGGELQICKADESGYERVETCQYGCEDGACHTAPAAIEILPRGLEIIASGQTVPFTARALDEDGHPIPSMPVTWSITNPGLASVTSTGDFSVSVKGLAIGGGDAIRPNGTLKLEAKIGDIQVTRLLQVVQLNQGTGFVFVPVELSTAPASVGADHYDGVFQTALSPIVSQCNPYNGSQPAGCTWKNAEARLFEGHTIEVRGRGTGKWGDFGIGVLEHPEVVDASGLVIGPREPRPLYIEWSSADTAIAEVRDGFVTAKATGRTTVSAKVGPQTWTFDIVAYDRFGYDPVVDFAPGIEPEDGHLVLFSSSSGMAIDGTLDTVRYVDLDSYENLDFRPSQYGPQGVRLVENINGVRERHTGFGCGYVRGRGDIIWLLNGWTAVPFDVRQAKQVGNLNTVEFRTPNAAGGANAVCSGAFVEFDGRSYLIGFDSRPYGYSAYVADVTDLDSGNVIAKGLTDPIFSQTPPVEFYNPQVFTRDGFSWLLFAEQTPRNNPAAPNKLRVASLSRVGNDLAVILDDDMTVETAPTPNAADNIAEAPGLAVAEVAGKPFIFVGNKDTITVIDADTWDIVDFSGSGSTNPLLRDFDTRQFGANIRAFAKSPDGRTLFFLPETSYPDAPFFNTRVEWRTGSGVTSGTNMTVHRLGLIDLGAVKPRLQTSPTDPRNCYRLTPCTADQFEYGYDLNLLELKQWMLATGLSPSTGAILPPQAMNIRQVAVGHEAIFLIGNDHPDGAGTALGNMSDVAVIHRTTGRMAAFRGWRSDPARLQGLSDPFGFRVGEDDAVLGNVRTKNAGILWLDGAPPAERAGDGTARLPDATPPLSKVYANAPTPAAETGRVMLLSSSHVAPTDGTHDVIRSLDLAATRWQERDFDPAIDGAQGAELEYVVSGELIKWRGGCGTLTAPDGTLWLLNGDSAIVFDPTTMSQGANGHQVTFDPNPAAGAVRICTGAFVEQEGRTWLVGVNIAERPNPLLMLADVTDIASSSVTATAVTSPFFVPNPNADPYFVRYVAAVTVGDEVWVLEENDPWNNMRNTVHRAVFAGGKLTFDLTRSSDLTAGFTLDGDPNMAVVTVDTARLLLVGNQNSVAIFDVTIPDLPKRINFNADGDGVQDDLDTSWYGRGIQGFAVSPDGTRVYALPAAKSAALPRATFDIIMSSGPPAQVYADRYRMAVLDLSSATPRIDASVNNGNGIDLNYWWFKQWILDHHGLTPLPPMFPNFRRQFAASSRSLFLIGADADGGTGSALANAGDLATYDLATGRGHLWRGYTYQGISNAGALWGFDLGLAEDGLDDENLGGARAKNAGVLFLP